MTFLYKLAVPAVTGGVLIAGTRVLGLHNFYTDLFIISLLGGASILREFVGYSKYRGKEQIKGKTLIVTGANTGVGKETVRDLARRGGRVIMACRDPQKCEAARQELVESTGNDNIVSKQLDLASMQSIRDFCADINKTESRLDILINNAGVMRCPKQHTKDGLDMQMGTNHFGHFLLTELLVDKLKASAPSRIVILSSTAVRLAKEGLDFDDINCEKNYSAANAYGRSKIANIFHAQELARRLEGTGVTTYAVHPGVVDTELGRHVDLFKNPVVSLLLPLLKYYLLKTPVEGAATTIRCALDPALENVSGRYYADCKEKTPAPQAVNPGAAKRLWKISEDITREKKTQ